MEPITRAEEGLGERNPVRSQETVNHHCRQTPNELSTSKAPPHRGRRRHAASRRASGRTMSELIKAVSESAPYLMKLHAGQSGVCDLPLHMDPVYRDGDQTTGFDRDEADAPGDTTSETSSDGDFDRLRASTPRSNGEDRRRLHPSLPRQIKLLSSRDLLREKETDTELTCDYCHRAFSLKAGGASFGGKAACMACEQRLNRDVVLPAMNHHNNSAGPGGPAHTTSGKCEAPAHQQRLDESAARDDTAIEDAEFQPAEAVPETIKAES